MFRLGIKYFEARSLADTGRQRLNLPPSCEWSVELEEECARLYYEANPAKLRSQKALVDDSSEVALAGLSIADDGESSTASISAPSKLDAALSGYSPRVPRGSRLGGPFRVVVEEDEPRSDAKKGDEVSLHVLPDEDDSASSLEDNESLIDFFCSLFARGKPLPLVQDNAASQKRRGPYNECPKIALGSDESTASLSFSQEDSFYSWDSIDSPPSLHSLKSRSPRTRSPRDVLSMLGTPSSTTRPTLQAVERRRDNHAPKRPVRQLSGTFKAFDTKTIKE